MKTVQATQVEKRPWRQQLPRIAPLSKVLPMYVIHLVLILSASAIWQHYFGTLSKVIKGSYFGVFIAGLSHWDATWFLEIAQHGYVHSSPNETAFFPLYPWVEGGLGRALDFLLHGHLVMPSDKVIFIAGILISNVCFVVTLVVLYHIGRLKFRERQVLRGLWLLVLFPSSYYFSAAYSESLFLMLIAAGFLSAYRKSYVWAAIFIGLGTLSWDLGPFAVFSLLWMIWREFRNDHNLRRAIGRAIAVCLIPLISLLSYLWLQYKVYGDPLMFLHAESQHWHRHFTWIWTSLHLDYQNDPIGFLASVSFLIMLVFAIRKIPFEQWLYSASALLIPLFSVAGKYPMSMVRFVLVLFPLFLFLGASVRKSETYFGVIAVFVVMLVWLTGLFASGHWVA